MNETNKICPETNLICNASLCIKRGCKIQTTREQYKQEYDKLEKSTRPK